MGEAGVGGMGRQLGSAAWAISWGRRLLLLLLDLHLVHELQRPAQFLICSFCHGPMGPQPEAARENIYTTLYV